MHVRFEFRGWRYDSWPDMGILSHPVYSLTYVLIVPIWNVRVKLINFLIISNTIRRNTTHSWNVQYTIKSRSLSDETFSIRAYFFRSANEESHVCVKIKLQFGKKPLCCTVWCILVLVFSSASTIRILLDEESTEKSDHLPDTSQCFTWAKNSIILLTPFRLSDGADQNKAKNSPRNIIS